MAEMEDRWLSVEEISKYLGVSSDTVYRWIENRRMPAHRLGRLWKFKRDEIDNWVKAGSASRQDKATPTSRSPKKKRNWVL
jgi:excisionase family DNA binding protein